MTIQLGAAAPGDVPGQTPATGSVQAAESLPVDLRTASLTEFEQVDFRALDRDFFADEAAAWDRLARVLERMPGDPETAVVAPSDGGGPDWTALDHVAHLADWADISSAAIVRVRGGAPWPTTDDYGDFDAFNESRRAAWGGESWAVVRRHLDDSRARLLALAQSLPAATIREDGPWLSIFYGLHGHVLDHIAMFERVLGISSALSAPDAAAVPTPAPTGRSAAAPDAPVAPPRGLLAIFAHPDDESYGVGGVLALAAARGVPTHIVCATDGDLGGEAGARELDRDLRRGELRDAMTALGVPDPIFLGYRDSGMENWPRPAECLANADAEEVVDRLVSILAELRPAVVLTFDPGGIYGHPDHVTISARATEAYQRAARLPDGPRFLYHQAIPRSGLAEMARIQELFAAGRGDAAPPSEDDLLQQRRFVELARPDEEVTTIIDVRSVLDRKLAALAAHASQMRDGSWADAPREIVEQFLGRETFVRVDPPPGPGERETEFRGVV